ncbi:unnamed protein product [marine sediment metagenome]|uniref:TMhelix containing protein n=1 Tax=marine sediment metagenome TaxID=412755 RepID=X0S6E2_9ZZZZ
MGILRTIFGRPEDASKIIDGATKGLDKIFFTKEERADANQKLSDWYLKYLEATSGQNVARRFIALVVVYLWAGLILLGVTSRYWSVELSDHIYHILQDVVMNPFLVIIGFYFLSHAVRAYKK